MDLSYIFKEINFVRRYTKLCNDFNDFENRLSGNKRGIYDNIIQNLGYKVKYFKNGNFYQISSQFNKFLFNLNLVLKDGAVEALIYITFDGNECLPKGRFDFIPERIGIAFDKENISLPLYRNDLELEEILKEIFSIYKDIKKALLEL